MKKLFFQIILPVIAIAGILGFITLLSPIKKENAAWFVNNAQQYACGNITVHIAPHSENQSCPTGTASISSYQTAMDIWATGSNTGDYTAHWNWASYWCAQDSSGSCQSNGTQTGIHTANLGSASTVSSNTTSASGQFAGLACGHYQNDFGFYVTNTTGATVCGISLNDLGNRNNNAAWCHAGTCQAPTATPVPPTATPTQPVQQPTATPTPTGVQPTATPTPTGVVPTATATPTTVPGNSCTNGSCDTNSQNQQQQQQQTQNNNQTVNITLGNGQQQQQQQVLAASTAPTQLPSTGAEGGIVFGLLALAPIGWKIRKLI